MNVRSSRAKTPRFLMASIALIVLVVGLLACRVASMNSFSADDDNPVIPFAVLFIVATIVPLAGTQRSRPWRGVVVLQGAVALIACATLFGFGPSGDGLYVLPIAAASVVTLVVSIWLTFRLRSACSQQSG